MSFGEPMHPAYFEIHFYQELPFSDWPPQFAIITRYATTGEAWPVEQNRQADLQTGVRPAREVPMVKTPYGLFPLVRACRTRLGGGFAIVRRVRNRMPL